MNREDDLVRDFLAKGGKVTRVAGKPTPKRKRTIRRGKFKAASAFKSGGKLS